MACQLDPSLAGHPRALEHYEGIEAALKAGDVERVWEMAREGVRLWPSVLTSHLYLGVALIAVDKPEAAYHVMKRLYTITGGAPMTAAALATAAAYCGYYGTVARMTDKVMASGQQPFVDQCRYALGTLKLQRRMWREAWDLLEAEYSLGMRSVRWTDSMPRWDGRPSQKGRKLCVHWDQGYGDTILMARFLPRVKEQWKGYVALLVRRDMERLAAQWKGFDELDVDMRPSDPAIRVDSVERVISICALPHVLGIGSTAEVSENAVLAPAPAPQNGRLRVGLCWRGSDEFRYNIHRSVPFEQMKTLLGVDGVEYVSLQHGRYADECTEPAVKRPLLGDLADTAEVIRGLDIVITVDTVVANLAGSMGREVWVLVWNPLEIRWGVPGSEESVWYPSARVHWKQRPGGWLPVLLQVRQELEERARMKKPCVST